LRRISEEPPSMEFHFSRRSVRKTSSNYASRDLMDRAHVDARVRNLSSSLRQVEN